MYHLLFRKNWSYSLSFLVIIILGGSCSVEKNTNMSRFYHNLTSHYNIYFNGKESYERGMEKIISSGKDDYSIIMPLFEWSNPEAIRTASSDMERAKQKASKLISLHSITSRPEVNNSKELSGKEKEFYELNDYNKWVDDSYLLLGKAQFMKHEFNNARITFLHNLREADDQLIKYESQVWLARIQVETGNYSEARRLLNEFNNAALSKNLLSDILLTRADAFIREENYVEAIAPLEAAVDMLDGNYPVNRYTYILARLNEETGNSPQASKYYRKVLKLNPPYELAFNARINQAGVFDVEKGDVNDIRRELNKLLRDIKNKEYRDQILYSLGQLSMREGNIEKAIEYLHRSAAESTVNTNQKGRSYLGLADYYFEKDKFLEARVYYDSAVFFLDNNYPGYEQFFTRSVNLNQLGNYLVTIQREDSLQLVAQMPEDRRNALIDGIIRDLNRQEQELDASRDDRYNMGQFYESQRRFRENVDLSGKWYFYNQAALTFGRTEFRNRWGQRRLEDNWRRKNKSTINSSGMVQEENILNPADTSLAENNIKNPEYYLKELPLSDSMLAVSDDKIANALFNAGRIFSEQLDNDIMSKESFSALIERYPGHSLTPQALFFLYNLSKESDPGEAGRYETLLLNRYPESEFTKIISDPGYYKKIRNLAAKEQDLYNRAFNAWKADSIRLAATLCEQGLSEYPSGELSAKFMLLRAYALAPLISQRELKAELVKIRSSYPDDPVGEKAALLIEHINRETPELKIEEEKIMAGDIYMADTSDIYYFVIIVKNKSLDLNQLTFNVINYNIDNYTNNNFNARGTLVEDSYLMIEVGILRSYTEAEEYYRRFEHTRILQNAANSEILKFIISKNNLESFRKDLDPDRYYLFFRENYPGLFVN